MDRYISIICGASSIREVIAFPKTIEGRDLMSEAPATISDEDKKLYHIQIADDASENVNRTWMNVMNLLVYSSKTGCS